MIIVIEFNEYGIRILSTSKSEFLEITSFKHYTDITNYHLNQEQLLMMNGVLCQIYDNNFEYYFKYTPIIGSIISDENFNNVGNGCDMQNGYYNGISMNIIHNNYFNYLKQIGNK